MMRKAGFRKNRSSRPARVGSRHGHRRGVQPARDLDDFTREYLAPAEDTSLSDHRVARDLDRLKVHIGSNQNELQL